MAAGEPVLLELGKGCVVPPDWMRIPSEDNVKRLRFSQEECVEEKIPAELKPKFIRAEESIKDQLE